MANIIDKDFFKGNIDLPVGQPDVQAEVNMFIGNYEPEYLQKALGYAFWKLFIVDGVPSSDARFQLLLNGGEYTDANNVLRKWQGLITATKISPIADYVYYWYTRNAVSYTTNVGEQKGKAANSGNVTPFYKQQAAWNGMVKLTVEMWCFLKFAKNDDGTAMFPEWVYEQTDFCTFKRIGFL